MTQLKVTVDLKINIFRKPLRVLCLFLWQDKNKNFYNIILN